MITPRNVRRVELIESYRWNGSMRLMRSCMTGADRARMRRTVRSARRLNTENTRIDYHYIITNYIIALIISILPEG